jgi:hypothetical protein
MKVVPSMFVTNAWGILCVCVCVSVWRAESSSVCRAVRQAGDCYGNYCAYINSTADGTY